MLNLNSTSNDVVWKVLIYDQVGQDIISPIFKVNDLRSNGITVHMNIHSERQPIPDVPAIYFVEPTLDNIRRMGDDFSKGLYESYYINFCSSVPRPLLEELASICMSVQPMPNIAQVFDQYVNYTCLESKLFCLNAKGSYRLLNDPKTADSIIESLVGRMVDSLFSVFVTMGNIPIIRAAKGNAAEMVAVKLESKLRDHLLNSRHNNLFNDSNFRNLTRPVLVLIDRNMDLSSMFNHAWTYSAMVHDLLEMKMNLVQVTTDEKKRTTYDIDTANDFFWKKNSGLPFPQVAEDVNAELSLYKKEVEEITKSCGVSSLEEVGDNTRNLALAVTQLPLLTQKKRIIDMHMNIAYSLMNIVENRQIDKLFAAEESINKQTRSTILEIIQNPKMIAQDKLRLFLIYYLTVPEIPVTDLKEFEQALNNAGCSMACLSYIKSIKSFARISQPNQTTNTSSDLLGRFTPSVGGHLGNFLASVKDLLPSRKDLAITRTVDCLMEGKEDEFCEEFLYLDPKLARGTKRSVRGPRDVYTDAVVFVVGGGNYLEYHNLMDYAERTSGTRKKIFYGSTEVLTSFEFCNQIEPLGQ